MADKKFAKLEEVDLRSGWNHEARDFTQWLAEPENLELLGDEIGVPIQLVRTEAEVGRFNVDILAKEESTGRKIIIENQLEKADHAHLGQLLTYAAGHDASIVVWVVKDVVAEYQKAIEWLNTHTDDTVGFFLVRIRLFKIENSKPAPSFEVIESPNEWAKTVQLAAKIKDERLSETNMKQLEFWTAFRNWAKAQNGPFSLRTPGPQNWFDVSMGSSEAHIALTINSLSNTFSCGVYINENKELFQFLSSKKVEIEAEIGESLAWIEAVKATRIKIDKPVKDVFNSTEHESIHFKWLMEQTVLFLKVFKKYFELFKKENR